MNKKTIGVVAWSMELGILGGLFWKYYDVGHNIFFCRVSTAIYPGCLIFIFGVMINWLLVADRRQFRLWLLTGPCVVMAAFLVVILSWKSGPLVSKDISAAAWERHVPESYYGQWLDDYFNKVRSERLSCAIITASTILLYTSQFSNARKQKRCQECSVENLYVPEDYDVVG